MQDESLQILKDLVRREPVSYDDFVISLPFACQVCGALGENRVTHKETCAWLRAKNFIRKSRSSK